MGFTIDSGIGGLGALVLVLVVASAGIFLFWLLTSAKQAHDDVVEDDPDHKGPIL